VEFPQNGTGPATDVCSYRSPRRRARGRGGTTAPSMRGAAVVPIHSPLVDLIRTAIERLRAPSAPGAFGTAVETAGHGRPRAHRNPGDTRGVTENRSDASRGCRDPLPEPARCSIAMVPVGLAFLRVEPVGQLVWQSLPARASHAPRTIHEPHSAALMYSPWSRMTRTTRREPRVFSRRYRFGPALHFAFVRAEGGRERAAVVLSGP
jgi:hypothetical protein